MTFFQSDALPYLDNTTLPLTELYSIGSPNYQHNASQNITGNDTGDTPYEDYKNRPETYMVPIMFSIIFVVGVVGNGTLIVVFIKHRAMRNIPNTWVLSITILNLCLFVKYIENIISIMAMTCRYY